jgi:hypothetical protein
MAQEKNRYFKSFSVLLALVCILFVRWDVAANASPAGIRAGESTEVVFGSVKEGKRILGSRDEYIERMSPFDRSVRMKIERDVTIEEFVAFVGTKVLSWESDEKKRIESAFLGIQAGLKRVAFPDLGTITMVKTTGEEEGNAAYTRGNAIVLPQSMIRNRKTDLKRLLAHELFHVFSRNRPMVRAELYEAIGFRYCGELDFPPALGARRITNPDAPRNDHCIRVKVNGEPISVMPILFTRTATYDVRSDMNLFNYIQFALLQVTEEGRANSVRPMLGDEGPILFDVDQVELFFEQVGRNTDYIIHPEEILAENFALLVLGEENAPSPEILLKVKNSLSREEM